MAFTSTFHGEQGVLQAHTPLTTAEMASTFGEMLVFSSFMEQESDAKVRAGNAGAQDRRLVCHNLPPDFDEPL